MSSPIKKNIDKFLSTPWYFAVFAIYPPLALIAFNINELRPVDGVRSMVLSLLAALLIFGLLWLVLRSKQRAALLVTLLLVLFYSYGHVYSLATRTWGSPALDWVLPMTWLILAGFASFWLARRKTHVRKATPVLNLIILALAITSAVQVLSVTLPRNAGASAEHAPVQELTVPDGQQPPDIYYIIVDSYGRSDLLERSFNIDNTQFIQDLEELGFYVADCSQSNYNRTEVSLASSMNMTYLQDLDDAFQPPSQGRVSLWDSISHSAVRADLEGAGYRTVTFATGFPWSEIDDADVYLAPSPLWSEANNFETMMLRTTVLRSLDVAGDIDLYSLDSQQFGRRTELIFDSMDDLARMPGPKFVFIHIIPPHPPFIYAPDGSWTDPNSFLNEDDRYTGASYTQGYTNQLEYINSRLIPALQTLLEGSPTEPIIILQADHAPWLQRDSGKFMILNAYHLPGHNELLYPTISPVNSFRVVLDTYLGADYPLLEDISYYSPTPNIYEFEQMLNPCLTP